MHLKERTLLYQKSVASLSYSRSKSHFLSADDVRQFQVTIPHSGPVSASLGSSISIPCLVSLSPSPASSSSSPVMPRVKWSVISGGVEKQILVARGQRVKVNEAYEDRAVRLNYTFSPYDLSLWLGDLRSSDSGHYRCEVQQGLEDASDVVQLKVKGNGMKKKVTHPDIHSLDARFNVVTLNIHIPAPNHLCCIWSRYHNLSL